MSLYDLPPELVNYIYSLSGNVKRQKKKMERELLKKSTMKELNKIYERIIDPRYLVAPLDPRHLLAPKRSWYLRYLLYNKVNDNDYEQFFKNISNCRCCKMHRTNVPKTIESVWDEQPIGSRNYEQPICKCKCRHFRRMLCRWYNIKNGLSYVI